MMQRYVIIIAVLTALAISFQPIVVFAATEGAVTVGLSISPWARASIDDDGYLSFEAGRDVVQFLSVHIRANTGWAVILTLRAVTGVDGRTPAGLLVEVQDQDGAWRPLQAGQSAAIALGTHRIQGTILVPCRLVWDAGATPAPVTLQCSAAGRPLSSTAVR